MSFFYNVLVPNHLNKDSFTYISQAPVKRGVRVLVPFGNKQVIGIIDNQADEPDFACKEIISVLDDSPVVNEEQWQLASELAYENVVSITQMLESLLPSLLKPAIRKGKVAQASRTEKIYHKAQPQKKLSERQQALYEKLEGPVSRRELLTLESSSVIDGLVKKGALREELVTQKIEASYPIVREMSEPWPVLTDKQQAALAQLKESQEVSLLYGVTGSGKTELFFALIEEALKQGKQALILVPEIGLSPMMARRIARRFNQDVVIYHSGLNHRQALAIYQGVQNKTIPIVVGTRSAAFLPFSDLGLIVMDEEHDSSYQSGSMPFYHTRDIVLKRASHHQAKVVLASATPSLESYARARKGVYQLVRLDERINQSKNRLRIVDLSAVSQYQGISLPLIEAIEKRLDRGEQVVLLLNRRGYLPIYKCSKCGQPLLCDECNIALSWHKQEDQLVCHICGKRFERPHTCPHCGSPDFSQVGLGTEKLSETLQELFPQARILRMDADTTRKKDAHQDILSQFEKEGDILLGTQMVAKGHDFGRVTLVGILNADQMLLRPDFRCNEMTYQLLEQAAGRAGRGELAGEVIIQTYNPDHYVLALMQNRTFDEYFVREMKYRHVGHHPPYQYMAMLVFSHKDFEQSWQTATQAIRFFQGLLIETLGPVEISMRKKQRRIRLLLRHKNPEHLLEALWSFRDWAKQNSRVSISIHNNPMRLEE